MWKKKLQCGMLIQLWTSAIMLLLRFTETESGGQMEPVSFQSGGTVLCTVCHPLTRADTDCNVYKTSEERE